MPRPQNRSRHHKVRGQNDKANSLGEVARQTAKLWRKHHLTYDQTKHVVEQTRRELGVEAPRERRRTVERLDRVEVESLIESAYGHSSQIRRNCMVGEVPSYVLCGPVFGTNPRHWSEVAPDGP